MKKLLATTFSSILTLSSVALTISTPANALNSNFQTETTSPTNPSPETLIAGYYCETRTDGYRTATCCIDSYGNWACTWR